MNLHPPLKKVYFYKFIATGKKNHSQHQPKQAFLQVSLLVERKTFKTSPNQIATKPPQSNTHSHHTNMHTPIHMYTTMHRQTQTQTYTPFLTFH